MLDDAVTRWRLSGPFGRRHAIVIAARRMYSDIVRYLSAAIIAGLPHPRSISRYRLIDKNPRLILTYLLSYTVSKLWLITGQICTSERGMPHFNNIAINDISLKTRFFGLHFHGRMYCDRLALANRHEQWRVSGDDLHQLQWERTAPGGNLVRFDGDT